MAFATRFSPSFPCLFCARRLLRDDTTDLAISFHRQIRGKKKKAKPTGTINVRLLEDIAGYGRQGSIIPVAPGRMRNIFYPRQKAAYVTEAELRDLKKQNIVIERDFNFGVTKSEAEENVDDGESPSKLRDQLLAAERTTNILSRDLPPWLVFYRKTIPQPTPEPVDRSLPLPQAALDAIKAPVVVENAAVPIYGSVSTADIAESVKALLAQTEEGKGVILGADNVKIIRAEDAADVETDRLKTLGEVRVEFQVKGGAAVIRTVSVQDSEKLKHLPDRARQIITASYASYTDQAVSNVSDKGDSSSPSQQVHT